MAQASIVAALRQALRSPSCPRSSCSASDRSCAAGYTAQASIKMESEDPKMGDPLVNIAFFMEIMEKNYGQSHNHHFLWLNIFQYTLWWTFTFCYGKIHHFQWVNPQTKWQFSIAMLNYQRVSSGEHSIFYGSTTIFKGIMEKKNYGQSLMLV